jgi:hypothetical protein
MSPKKFPFTKRQSGAAAVEFSIVALLFFTLVFGIFEFGRILYVYNTMQEVTRRAAREAVVRWIDQGDEIKALAVFGGTSIPAGAEVSTSNITIEYLNKTGLPIVDFPTDPGDNLSACGDVSRGDSCIFNVRVSLVGVKYVPMISLFSTTILKDFQTIPLPDATVTMHAESMGFTTN